MTNMEFDPIIDGLHDTLRLGAWLVGNQAKLDVSEGLGLAATRLVVEDNSGRGQWCIPLLGAIDMVDIRDGWFATADPANIAIKDLHQENPVLEVFYNSIDGETRSSTIDPTAAATFEPIQIIPNN
jgi:hypothetical protein